MDGYSVQDAASVLGVAEGRVWELLARGVLLGTPEGDSMRVFFKAEPAPIATAGTRDEAPRTNGNGGTHAPEGEASAFRELLTEFRNLTERYGQALLALGEARGEVAGLRSRVDLLEARLDVRMPPPFESAPVAWESATIPAAATPAAPPEAPAPAPRTPRPRKARSSREATAGFAEALARALDPSPAEVRPAPTEAEVAPETAEPIAPPMAAAPEVPEESVDELLVADEAPSAEIVVENRAAEAAAEPLVAQAVEPEAPTYSAVVVEPDWFADGDFAWLNAADVEASAAPEAAVMEADAALELAPEPEPEPEPPLEAAEPEPPLAVATELPVLPEPELPVEPIAEAPLAAAPVDEIVEMPVIETEADFEVRPAPAPGVSESTYESAPAADPQTMGSAVAVEEEVMWLGAEPSPIAWHEPQLEVRAQAEPWPAVDAPPRATEVVRPPLAMTEDELARLALDEGWDEAEVAAIRAMITPIPSASVDLPGAAELHEAMAALEAVPVRVDPTYDASRQWAKPALDDGQPFGQDDWVFGAEPAPPPAAAPRPPSDVTSTLRRSATDPGWLRRRQGPAAAAYRRLRRIFPG